MFFSGSQIKCVTDNCDGGDWHIARIQNILYLWYLTTELADSLLLLSASVAVLFCVRDKMAQNAAKCVTIMIALPFFACSVTLHRRFLMSCFTFFYDIWTWCSHFRDSSKVHAPVQLAIVGRRKKYNRSEDLLIIVYGHVMILQTFLNNYI